MRYQKKKYKLLLELALFIVTSYRKMKAVISDDMQRNLQFTNRGNLHIFVMVTINFQNIMIRGVNIDYEALKSYS